jgi:hypothetical protein
MTKRKPLRGLVRIDRVLDGTLKGLGLEVRLRERGISALWSEVVGPKISSHAQPIRVQGSRLFVGVEDSVWLHQLSFLREKILQDLNQRAGQAVLKDIVLQVAEISPVPDQDPEEKDLSPPLPEDLTTRDAERVRELLSFIPEEEIRRVVGRILTRHFRSRETSQQSHNSLKKC